MKIRTDDKRLARENHLFYFIKREEKGAFAQPSKNTLLAANDFPLLARHLEESGQLHRQVQVSRQL